MKEERKKLFYFIKQWNQIEHVVPIFHFIMLLAASSEKLIALLIIKYPFHFVYIALNELQSFRGTSIKVYGKYSV